VIQSAGEASIEKQTDRVLVTADPPSRKNVLAAACGTVASEVV
jgi:hypothetical protein